jgi:hypothetical protein
MVDAVPEGCCSTTADFERWGDWARDVEQVAVVERTADGRSCRVAFSVDLFGKDYSATMDFDLGAAPKQLSFTLVEARKLRAASGLFQFEPSGGKTMMSFRVSAELVKPKPARVERLIARRVETMLVRDLKRYIERNTRRR